MNNLDTVAGVGLVGVLLQPENRREVGVYADHLATADTGKFYGLLSRAAADVQNPCLFQQRESSLCNRVCFRKRPRNS